MSHSRNNALKSPLQKVDPSPFTNKPINLFLKRDDLLPGPITGNKKRKLEGYVEVINAFPKNTALYTFGGAYSNHIYACSSFAKSLNRKLYCIIRGEEHLPLNPILQHAQDTGAEILCIDRSTYKRKTIRGLGIPSDAFCIPEGGTSQHSLASTGRIVDEIDIAFNYIILPVGTGGTIAGIASRLSGSQKAIGISALKNNIELEEAIAECIPRKALQRIDLHHNYHFGGFAKTTPALWAFVEAVQKEYGFEIDALYGAKALYGLFDLIKNSEYPANATYVFVVTANIAKRSNALLKESGR